jgi:glycosyltransferase involved in cell wall biosynthesis
LLLVRNGVDHDARVLRAARIADATLGGGALIVGVATASAPAGATSIEGVAVVRLPARPAAIERLKGWVVRNPAGAKPSHSDRPLADGGAAVTDDAHIERNTKPSSLTLSERARRILSGIAFSLQAIVVARRVRPALVHANDWNTMWAALCIKYVCGARVVYDSHELWADRNGRWEWRPWLLACEALFVRIADVVLTSSPGYADALATRYRISRPAVVRNIPERRGARAAASGARPAAPLVVYIGGLMPGRGLEQMIDALALVPEARLRTVGPGGQRYRERLLERATTAGVADRVDLRRAVAPAEVPAALAEAAAGLCLIQPICRSYELCLPNKLFEYAAAAVPVLASDLPVIADVVRGEGVGEIAPAGDYPQAIAASLRRLLEPERWTRAAERVRVFAAAHDWTGEALILKDVYERAICQPKHP